MKGKIKKRVQQFNLRLGSHYRRSLITILLFASLPGIVIGFIMFIVSKEQIEHELQSIHQNQLHQTAEAMDDQFSFLEQSIAHWAFDSKFTDNLKNLDFAYKYKEIHEIYRTLLVMEGSNPLVERVELYVNEPESIIFTKDRYTFIDDAEIKKRYNRLLEHNKSLFWSDSFEQTTSVNLVHKIPGIGAKPFGVLVMYLHKDKVLRLVKTLTPYNQGTTFLFQENGGWLFTATQHNRPTALDQSILEQVLGKEEKAGTFIYEWQRNTYSVTYGNFSRVGTSWFYASAAPLTSITAPVMFISKLIIVTSGAIFLTAVILSWFASRRLYSPIASLMNKISGPKDEGSAKSFKNEFEMIESQWNNLSRESQTLQSHLERQLPHLREGFLLQLLHGYMYSYSEEELIDRMEQFGREVHNQRYCLVFIQLLGFSKLDGRFSEGDEGLVTFAAANMVEELIQNLHIEADVINFHDLSVGVLVSLPNRKTREQFDTEVYQISEEIIACVERILHMQATVCISSTTDSIKMVPVLFEETKLAVSFRNVNDSKQIIEIEKLGDAERDHAFDYPFDLEKQVLHSIRIGKGEEAVAFIKQFVQELSYKNANEAMMRQGMLHLLGSILHVVLQSGLSMQQIYDGANLYEQLCQIRETDEIVDWFGRKVIFPFIRDFSQKQNMQMRQTIEKAIELLQQQYKSDVSLDSCADVLKMSPFVLSKAFKEVVGINFIDYLTNIRLDKARELLRETDLKISEVAGEVGYQHSYFNRLFKKQEGITPSLYREMSRPVK
jgi:AraC-like DNA-binding protein